jgi:adenylate kinase
MFPARFFITPPQISQCPGGNGLVDRKKAIVITGTPGTGKSSVAEIVAEKLNIRLLSLNQIAAESGALSTKDWGRDTTPIKMGALRKALVKRLGEGGGAVVEGHFSEVVPKGYVRIVIVLRTDPLVLKERLKQRGYAAEKVKENVEAELLDACLIEAIEAFGKEMVREVDTTSTSSEDASEQVLAAIEGRGGLPAGSISWVSRLEDAGRLRDLIP